MRMGKEPRNKESTPVSWGRPQGRKETSLCQTPSFHCSLHTSVMKRSNRKGQLFPPQWLSSCHPWCQNTIVLAFTRLAPSHVSASSSNTSSLRGPFLPALLCNTSLYCPSQPPWSYPSPMLSQPLLVFFMTCFYTGPNVPEGRDCALTLLGPFLAHTRCTRMAGGEGGGDEREPHSPVELSGVTETFCVRFCPLW